MITMIRPGYAHRNFSIILALLIVASSVFGASGKITGRIIDRESQQPLPGANIMLTHAIMPNGSEVPLSRPLGSMSDPDGFYFILNVSPGSYILKASIIGYVPTTQKMIRVDVDRTITVDFELVSSAIEVEQVVVTARREIVKKDVSATQEVVLTSRIEEMPILRVDEFMGKMKGVELVSGTDGNGLSIRGGAIRETDIRLDGISLQDPRTENSYTALNSTTIEEIQVLTGGFEAKYGGIRSGLLNVVTREGQRERYSVSLRTDVAPVGKIWLFGKEVYSSQRFFGTNPWSNKSWIYKVYSGPYAWIGAIPQTAEDSATIPQEFWTFKGWNLTRVPGNFNLLDSMQKYDLWKRQHPQYPVSNKPNYYVEGSLTGPFPGSGIPLLEQFSDRSTFLLGFKYENSQLPFPLGPRNDYVDWNTQLKVTTQLQDNLRLSLNGLYAKIESVSGGQVTSYGGALSDASSSYNYLNSTESSERYQAGALLAGSSGMMDMFNKSRLQFYTQQYTVAGAKLTHTFSQSGFYTLDFQTGYTTQNLAPFSLDTSSADAWVTYYRATDSLQTNPLRFFNTPANGSPNGSTNRGMDVLSTFYMYGGPQRADSSHTRIWQLKGDMTIQLGHHHQFEAGIFTRLQDLFVYAGTWYQTQVAYTPDLWQYYKATPLDMAVYAQDKLEFEGMILNAGLRLDYFNPMRKGFVTGFPTPDAYKNLYDKIYLNLPGGWGSYERWLAFRDMIENPPGWPETENTVQIYLSPRMGVSFPVTEASKLYFNYGHFYQRAPVSFMYSENLYIGSVALPTPGLKMARTVSYEFGYEQMILSDLLLNVTAYYKDNRNEPLSRTFVNYYGDNVVIGYFPDGYSDIRGVEIRFEKPVGRFVSFSAMYDYSLYSSGQSGLATVYEDRLKAKTSVEERTSYQYNSEPRPRANVNLNLHTPGGEFGPDLFGVFFLNKIYANIFFEWRSGGRYLWNPEVADPKDRLYVDAVNYWNVDLRLSKAFDLQVGSVEFVLTIKNLWNKKWLIPGNMSRPQLTAYRESLHPTFKNSNGDVVPQIVNGVEVPGGGDKWGDYEADAIKIPWWQAPLFLSPRQILFGLRMNF